MEMKSKRTPKLMVADVCKNGHDITDKSYAILISNRGGKQNGQTTLHCRYCVNERNRLHQRKINGWNVDDSRPDHYKSRKSMLQKLYRLLHNKPDLIAETLSFVIARLADKK
jgi:hypothetical protein